MNNDPKLLKFLEDAPIFFQPWWLEAVSPGAWDYSIAHRGEEIAAVLAYTYKVRLERWRLIEMPRFTPYLGPWLRGSSAKYANKLSEEKDLLDELIAGVPEFASFTQNFHPVITNWLPFHWKGYQQTTRYTYIIRDTSDLKAVWDQTKENIRREVRKAQKQLRVIETDDIEHFARIHQMTFARQNKQPPYSMEGLRRLDKACGQNGARRIMVAEDKDGRSHAVVYLVADRTAVFYLMGGGDPELRNSGAASLLLWNAIERTSESRKRFDFEGSMIEPIERFFRAFGARQTPYFQITKMDSRALKLYRSFWQLTHAHQ